MKRPSRDMLIPIDALVKEWLSMLDVAKRSPRTIEFYRQRMSIFKRYCEKEGIKTIGEVDHRVLTQFLAWAKEGHNDGGVNAVFRSVRAFLNWFEKVYEPRREEWPNPLNRIIKPPKQKLILEPVPIEDVQKMAAYCERRGDFCGLRNRAILYCLLDTGARATELLNINIEDVDMQRGSIFVRHGKGDKPRRVFFGSKTKQCLRAYLRAREELEPTDPLFITKQGKRLNYWALQDLFEDVAEGAGVARPHAHSFRRAFALQSLRNGMDVYSLQKLMGHADLQVLRQYLNQNDDDLERAHRHNSPVDHM